MNTSTIRSHNVNEQVTVLARVPSFRSAWNHMLAFQKSEGRLSKLVLVVPEHLANELQVGLEDWPNVVIIPEPASLHDLRALIDTAYTLLLPHCEPGLILGVESAIQILEDNEGVSAVGGLLFSPDGSVRSGAFSIVRKIADSLIAAAPVEALEPVWLKDGIFAVTRVDYLGGLILCESDKIGFGFPNSQSDEARAFSVLQMGANSMVFSGFLVVGQEEPERFRLQVEPPQTLPEATYLDWQASSLREISILQAGRIVRLDSRREVVFYPDRRKKAVDGEGVRPAYDPSMYYRSASHKRQLGPGFESFYSLLMSSLGRMGPKNAQVELSEFEYSLILKARRLGRSLPTSWIARLRGFVRLILGLRETK